VVKIEEVSARLPAIEQYVYDTPAEDKMNTLFRVLQQHPSESTIVFFNMKATINEIAEKMDSLGVSYGCLHGDLEQRDRDRVMAMFRNGSYRILLATDVAARGLDIENLELVVNYDFPQQPDVYIHRIGRTGRAGKAGVAVTFTDPRDAVRIMELEKAAGTKFIRKPLGFKNPYGLNKELRQAAMTTLSISGGRKDKLRPGDILGALTGASGGLNAKQIGKIEIQDKYSYVAVATDVADVAMESLRLGRIKGQKFQVKFVK
jgi:ATP-independent RNA helicase DbpA